VEPNHPQQPVELLEDGVLDSDVSSADEVGPLRPNLHIATGHSNWYYPLSNPSGVPVGAETQPRLSARALNQRSDRLSLPWTARRVVLGTDILGSVHRSAHLLHGLDLHAGQDTPLHCPILHVQHSVLHDVHWVIRASHSRAEMESRLVQRVHALDAVLLLLAVCGTCSGAEYLVRNSRLDARHPSRSLVPLQSPLEHGHHLQGSLQEMASLQAEEATEVEDQRT